MKQKEIKFRGKRVDTRKWIFGDLIKHSVVDPFTYISQGTGLLFYDYEIGKPIKVYPDSVGQYIGLQSPLEMIEFDEETGEPIKDYEYRDLYIGDLVNIWIEADEWNNRYGINKSGHQLAQIVATSDLGYRLSFLDFQQKKTILGQEVIMDSQIRHFALEEADCYYIGNIHEVKS